VETELSALNIGDPLDENTQVGPIMTSQDCTGIENLLQNAKVNHSNMKVVLGGNRMNRKGWFFHPTIILTEESNQSEVFGPVIFIHPFKTLEHLTLTYGKIQFSTHTQWQEQSSSSQKPIISSQRILINQSISDFPYFPDSTVDELV
jgi:delta 1-pyrroline-5-carboxylate dehydrogenase